MNNKNNKVNKRFVSEIDKRLAEFDRTHDKSASQLAEIKKYQHIYKFRDNPIEERAEEDIWE